MRATRWSIALVCLFLVLAALPASAQIVHRPIQDFLAGQTQTTSWFEPETGNTMFVDYANRTNTTFLLGLPTGMDGSITERALRDGRADVKVMLHTSNAYTTAGQGGVGFVFGSTVGEIIGGREPGLGDSILTVSFINTAPGAPIPNLNNLIFFPLPGQELKFVSIVATAFGPLRALFGVPDETPGSAHTTQRGLFGVPGQGQGLDNDFPAERIVIKEVGRGRDKPKP
jgi:hypothetical protein